jgi:hypothetical protein
MERPDRLKQSYSLTFVGLGFVVSFVFLHDHHHLSSICYFRALYPFAPPRILALSHPLTYDGKQEIVNIHIWVKSSLFNEFTRPKIGQ